MEPELEVELELELEVEQELEPEAQLELELELEGELQPDHPIPEKYLTLVRNWELDPDFDLEVEPEPPPQEQTAESMWTTDDMRRRTDVQVCRTEFGKERERHKNLTWVDQKQCAQDDQANESNHTNQNSHLVCMI